MEKAFWPLLYLAWSDDLLSDQEFATLRQFFNSSPEISSEEKQTLLSWTNPENPPGRAILDSWKSEILQTLSDAPEIKTLYGLSLKLSGNDPRLEKIRPAFNQLQNELGILGEETLMQFRSGKASVTAGIESSIGFSPEKMASILSGDTEKIEKEVKTLLGSSEFQYLLNPSIPEYRQKVLEWCHILGEKGFGATAYPTAFGGGGDMKSYFAVMEALSYHDLSLVIKFGVQYGLWGMSVYFLGTEKHHAKYLKDIGSMKIPGCFAMTETHHGSNVKGLETTATYDHESASFIIDTPHENAQKEYIGNAAQHGKMATVFAQLIIDGTNYGVNTFIVPLRDDHGQTLPGITIEDCGPKMGLNGVDNGTIQFNNVRIPKENMLDRFASVDENGQFQSPIPSDNRRFFTMLGTLVGGRIGIPRSALSAMKKGVGIAIKYSDTRKQFGPEGSGEVPILNYRNHQRRLFPHLANAYAFHFALRYLTDRFLNRKESEAQEIEALAAGMKSYVTWAVRNALQESREAMGGKGYLTENAIDRLKNDTEIYTTFEGDNTVLMQLVAKNRLSEFRKEFGKLDLGGMITYVFENAKTVVSEKNPIATRRTDEEHLKDPEFHLSAFRYREKTILQSAAMRIKRLVDGGMDAYDAFNVAQHQMLDVARAYLERVILEQFLGKIDSLEKSEEKERLVNLEQLFALNLIEENKAWYLEYGYIEPVKSKAIRKTLNQLCWDLRSEAVTLVDGFGIPGKLYGAEVLR